jgi:Ca-activated chloride channel family protein
MIFKDIWVLLFSPLIIIFVYLLKRKDTSSSIRFSSKELIKDFKPTTRIFVARNLIYLRAAAAFLFILALARPQLPLEETRIETEGIDIVLAVDCSGSMLAEDFTIDGKRQNRLDVVKSVIKDFIHQRRSDRIGMIAFAARAYTVCPLTLDYDWLIKNLERVKIGSIEDGTAIGSAISSSLNRLRETEAKSKIVILLTDGINNRGKISPLTAAEAAKALGIKIYTIGAGTKGLAPYPVRGIWGRVVYQNVKIEIDEETLKKIAKLTDGQYYRATNTESLKKIYEEINTLEKTPIEESGFQEYEELFSKFLLLGLSLFMIEIILSNTLLRKLP